MDARNIKAALSRIAGTSNMYQRVQRRPDEFTAGWRSGEAALLFALYERSVLDHLGFQCGNRVTDGEIPSAAYTARTGVIETRNGPKNILEMLGVNPAWAWNQIQTAVNYSQRKEAA